MSPFGTQEAPIEYFRYNICNYRAVMLGLALTLVNMSQQIPSLYFF